MRPFLMPGDVDPAWVALSLAEHVGSKKLRALLAHFGGDPAAILRASPADLQAVSGIGPKLSATIGALQPDEIARAIPRWQAAGITMCTWDDPAYPQRLRSLDDAPPTLFMRGTLDDQRPAAAVVGTRQPSPAARESAAHMSALLAERGYIVVSGLALGVDHWAHLGALSVPGGLTAAVLGSGILNIYPPTHKALATAIAGRGALLSEVHPQAGTNAARLVARNRLISGLSDLVIVVETSTDGGAMYAARRAREQGRPVYALDLDASGNRALLDEGALPISPDARELPF